LLVFKEQSGRYRWVGGYTNSLMDNSRPADIITSDAHRKAVERFDTGEIPYPPLYIWHEPSWKIGQTDDVFIDEIDESTVFVVATGYIDADKEYLVPYLSTFSTMSHGLVSWKYTLFTEFDQQYRHIEDYATVEISPLPDGPATPANPFTYFVVQEDSMAIKKQKRDALLGVLPEDIVEAIESTNKSIAQDAIAAGVQHKDNNMDENGTVDTVDTVVTNDVTTEAGTQVDTEEVQDATPAAPQFDLNTLAEQVAGVLKSAMLEEFATSAANILAGALGEVNTRVAQIESSVSTLATHVGNTDKALSDVKDLVGTPAQGGTFQQHLLKSFAKAASNTDGGNTQTEPAQAAASGNAIDNLVGKLIGGK